MITTINPEVAEIRAAIERGTVTTWEAISWPWTSHGCRAGWSGSIVERDEDGFMVEVAASTDCSSCWQTGCDGETGDNALIGQRYRVEYSDCHIGERGDYYSRA